MNDYEVLTTIMSRFADPADESFWKILEEDEGPRIILIGESEQTMDLYFTREGKFIGWY